MADTTITGAPRPAGGGEPFIRARATLIAMAEYAARVRKETDGFWPPAARATALWRGLEHIEAECRRAHAAVTTEGDG
jgi:hypothetical protein